MKAGWPMKISSTWLVVITAVFIVAADNRRFFSEVIRVFPPNLHNIGFLCSLVVVLSCVLVILFTLINTRWTLKPILILALLVAAVISYYSATFHVVMDETMIQNILETNPAEARDLLNLRLVLYMVGLGLFPAFLVWRTEINYPRFGKGLLIRTLTIFAALTIVVVVMLPFGRHYSSFFREHKPLRYQTNPTYALYSAGKFLNRSAFAGEIPLQSIALDAHRDNTGQRRLVVMVVGEAARADRLSLNGYERETNPLLAREDIVNFPQMYSCGTSTAVSVPCMFSSLDRAGYRDSKAKALENVLDVLARSGVEVLWRDNNSSSKGVAERLPYEDFRLPENNPICDEECRDEGMLVGLQDYIDRQPGDILIVLHQMGNHGPAYYKRYPKAFEKFTPVCLDNQLQSCNNEEVGNAYDNAILYTDYFLDQVIGLLRHNDSIFKTALVYMSDHGESLGEGGLYLHGLPYFIAPDQQTHVAALMWFGQSMRQEINYRELQKLAADSYSHDNLFHTLLGLFRVSTVAYNSQLDILAGARI